MMCLRTILMVQCFVCCVFALPAYKPYEILFEGKTGMMTHSLHGGSDISVSIGHCFPINTTYISEFKALNINTSIVKSLSISFKIKEALPPGNYTEGLQINFLSIRNDEHFEDIFNNTPNYFEELTDLKALDVSGIQIPPMTMELVNLSLTNGASITDWGNCRNLERLDLTRFTKTNLPKWPQNCTNLKYLEIDSALPDVALMLADRMIAAAPSINTLKITDCRLHKLPVEIISAAKSLVYLDLSDNTLYDEILPLFPHHATLKTLTLNSNLIRGYGLGSLVEKLPALVELGLRWEDDFISDCRSNFKLDTDLRRKFIEPLQNSSIEILDLGPTQIHLDCFTAIRFKNLKRLILLSPVVSSQDRNLKLMDLPRSTGGPLEIDFDYWRFEGISFGENDYELLRLKNVSTQPIFRNTVLVKNVPCDCQHGWLARGLRDFPHILSMPTLLCDNDYGVPILEVPREILECDLVDNRDTEGCLYRKSWSNGKVTAECNLEAWNKIENMQPLHGLNVSGQAVSTLLTKLPNTLQWLDLRRNLIARGNYEQSTALFANGRRVWLADNLLLCECDNWVFLNAIQQYHSQIQDYDQLTCVGTGEPLSSISTSVLCQVAFVVSLIVCGVLIVLIGVLLMLLRRYGEQVRMFLYSRGWCISCLQKRDLDDKPYDAFVSFAHEDQEYVMNTLLPGLENAPEQFRVCVHYRDWHVGDWIPAQIMRSVQLSKRTLIVLSRSFVASTWSTLELRYALANAAENPSAKVLVLIRDDILDMDLDTELKKYITYNTYLTCDDPWF
ncbi:TIR domain-containing protein [Phthorimaea operculella]|nr:TIR domain-containing protein [Phthorimaea operculella]